MSGTTFTASAAFWARAGVPEGPIVADLPWIRAKHPNEFQSDDDVADHIRFVLSGEAFWMIPGTAKHSKLFIRQESRKCSVVQLLAVKSREGAPAYRVLTAYTMRSAQIARAIELSGGPDANLESGGRGEDAAHPGSQGLPFGQASRRNEKDSLPEENRKPVKENPPPMSFGSKEWNEFYGLRHGSHAKGDGAKRAEKALKRSLTKKGEAEHHESIRKDVEAEGAKLARAQQAEDRAEARILGPTGRTHALKIALPSGTFGPADVEAFIANGWEVHPAGTVAAKTGLSLGAIEPWDVALNPSPDFSKILGPQLAARALVLAHPEAVISSDTVHEFRRAGYDVAAAPKGLRQGRKAKTNPGGTEKRVYEALKKAAQRGDAPTLEELADALSESPDSVAERLRNLARRGLAHPVRGGLFGSGWAPGAMQPALQFNPLPAEDMAGRAEGLRAQAKDLRANAKRHKDLAQRLKAVPPLQRDRMQILQTEAKAEELIRQARGLEASAGQLEAEARAAGHPASGQHVPDADTRPARKAEAGNMQRTSTTNATKATKTGRKASPKSAQPPAKKAAEASRPEPANKIQPLKSAKAERYRAEKAVEALLDQVTTKPTKPKKAEAAKGTLESATLKIRFNPGSAEDVARVWETWTGAKPGQVLKLSVDDPTGTLPADVALLGRVSRLIQPDGTLKDFNASGPLLVTDGKAQHVWMVHPKGFRFDLAPSVICYLAKKPKFGDRELVEYVHAFDRPARARMSGQVGTLTGGFRLTPRGIEG